MDAKEKIRQYLDHRAAEDEQFAKAYSKPGKNLGDCMKYILTEAKKRGNAVCMDDEDVFGLAVHYYDEDDVKIDRSLKASVRTAPLPKIELTEEEKAEARKEAQRRYTENVLQQMQAEASKSTSRKKKAEADESTPSLFDL